MSVSINLEKKVQTVNLVLEKRGLKKAPTCQVGFACDISGSMHTNFNRGVVQETVNRLLAVANRFDDNGEMEVWAFNSGSKALPPANSDHFGNYVDSVMLKHCSVNGSTSYAPVMKDIVNHYFYEDQPQSQPRGLLSRLFGSGSDNVAAVRKKETGDPAVNYFITDGDNNDKSAAEAVFKETADKKLPIYWMMVGIGTETNFSFIRKMADKYPNVGFVHLKDLGSTSDEELFDSLITTEFCEWTKG